MTVVTTENVAEILEHDQMVKVAGVDADGILRGKIMIKSKFLSSVKSGFGFSSAVFGWDMHDMLYQGGVDCSAEDGTYADFTAFPDLSSFRRLPWEDDIPFFLLTFFTEGKPVAVCPRAMLKGLTDRLEQQNFNALAGGKSAIIIDPRICAQCGLD
jgi:glutamine synthetase